MKTILHFFFHLFAMTAVADTQTLTLEPDGRYLNLEGGKYSLDSTITYPCVVVGRFISHGVESSGPLGGSRYIGAEMRVDHALVGELPERLACSYVVCHIHAAEASGQPSAIKMTPPKLDADLILFGSLYHDEAGPRLSITRYISATTANITHVGALLRKTRSKELAADPAKEKQLTEGLAAALKVAAVSPADQVEVKQAEGDIQADNGAWWWIGGGGIVLALLVVAWGRRRGKT